VLGARNCGGRGEKEKERKKEKGKGMASSPSAKILAIRPCVESMA